TPTSTLSLHDALPIFPVDDLPAQLRRVGDVDDRGVDVAAFERGERGAHVLHRDHLRRDRAPQADALEVRLRVDAGGHRGGVGERSEEHTSELQSLAYL